MKHHVRLAGGAFGPKDVVPVDERASFCGESCTKSAPAGRRKGSRTWCKGNEGTGFCGESCTKSAPAGRRKVSRTWCKGNGGTGFCVDSCTKSAPAGRRKDSWTWCKGNGGTGFCGESCTKPAPAGRRRVKPSAAQSPPPAHQKITKSVKTPGASGSVPLLSGLAASQYFLGFDGFKPVHPISRNCRFLPGCPEPCADSYRCNPR